MSAARILIATLGLLALAASASAECAWIVWASSVLPSTGDQVWSVIGAYSEAEGGKAACDAFTDKRNKATAHDERAKRAMRNLVCLPDTVDPRGPKGK
jgi:hypothetical protein